MIKVNKYSLFQVKFKNPYRRMDGDGRRKEKENIDFKWGGVTGKF